MAEAVKGGVAMLASDTGSPGAIGPRLAAAAAAAIALEVADTEPGAERERAIAAAMRFLAGRTATL